MSVFCLGYIGFDKTYIISSNKVLLVLGHLEIKNVPYISTIYALKTKHKVSIKSPLLVDIKSDKLLLS